MSFTVFPAKIINMLKTVNSFRKKFRLRLLSEFWIRIWIATQPAVICSKLTIETLEKGKKYIQSY